MTGVTGLGDALEAGFRVVAYGLLFILPGAWLAYGLPLRGLSGPPRLLFAAVCSPVVMIAEVHLLRWAGLGFAAATWVTIPLNLPALFWVMRRGRLSPRPRAAELGVWLVLGAVPAACMLLPHLAFSEYSAFTGHPWMHADYVYSYANGWLHLEETELAGVPLSYPVLGHLWHGVLALVADMPPVRSYFVANALDVLVIACLVASATACLGGGLAARGAAVVALLLGLDFLGPLLAPLAPAGWGPRGLLGDWRYTPWIWKYLHFGNESLASLGFAGLATALLRAPHPMRGDWLALVAVPLLLVGWVYPILFPAAVMLAAGWLLADFLEPPAPVRDRLRRVLPGVVVVGLVGLSSLAYMVSLTAVRSASGVEPSTARYLLEKIVAQAVAAGPLLALGTVGAWRLWSAGRRRPVIVLGTAALGSLALNLLLHIPNVRNEYKFLFTAALALAPLVGLAVEPLGPRLGRLALPLGFAVSVLLGLQVARKVHIKLEAAEPGRPRLETHSFALRLAESEELAAATDAIREGTPSDTILLADRAAIHLATPTQRHLWVPAHQEHGHPGVGPSSEVILLSWHGLDPEWVHVREALRDRLYAAPSSDAARRGALQRIRALGRPLAILLKRGRHTALRGWLRESGLGRPLPVSGSHEVWLVPASQGADREAREDFR